MGKRKRRREVKAKKGSYQYTKKQKVMKGLNLIETQKRVLEATLKIAEKAEQVLPEFVKVGIRPYNDGYEVFFERDHHKLFDLFDKDEKLARWIDRLGTFTIKPSTFFSDDFAKGTAYIDAYITTLDGYKSLQYPVRTLKEVDETLENIVKASFVIFDLLDSLR